MDTLRSEPLRKIAIIKKADKQMKKAEKSDPSQEYSICDFLPKKHDKKRIVKHSTKYANHEK